MNSEGGTRNGEWVTVRLGDVVEINPRGHTSVLSDNSVVGFVPMSAVCERRKAIARPETRLFSEVRKGYTPMQNGDVIVAKITPCFENGKVAIVDLEQSHAFGSTEFHVFRGTGAVDQRLVYHLLRSEQVLTQGRCQMKGAAGQKRVPADFFRALEFLVPRSVAAQRQIADILDHADSLRAKRRAALAELDSLVQSLFLEMFGDPATNPKGWPVCTIGDLLESASYGTSEKSGPSGEFPVLRMNNITRTGEMDFTDLKFMELPEKLHDRFLVRSGDVLFNRTNSAELVGKTGIFHESRPMAYAGYLIRLRANSENNAEFLCRFLNSGYSKRMLRGMCKSIIGMANINATEIQAMKIPKPPLLLQSEFARRVTGIESLKSAQRKSLSDMDTLFASLQHRAFRGKL